MPTTPGRTTEQPPPRLRLTKDDPPAPAPPLPRHAGDGAAYDALAELFLGGEPGTGRAARRDDALPSKAETDEAALTSELVILGHLPVRAGPWCPQYAKAAAEHLCRPTALLRLIDGQVSIDLFGVGPDARAGVSAEDLGHALARAAHLARHWIVQVDEVHEPALAGETCFDSITILASANDASIVAAYRTLKSLAGSERPAGAEDGAASLQVAVVGAAQDEAEAAVAKISQASSAFLQKPVILAAAIERMGPTGALNVFRGSCLLSPTALLAAVLAAEERGVVEKTIIAPRVETPARVEVSKPAVATMPPAVAPRTEDPAPDSGLVGHIAGLKPLAARCPDDATIELAVDSDGGLHLLRQDADGLGYERLTAAAAWARRHAELLILTAPGMRIDASRPPVPHLLTDQPKAVRHLGDAEVKLHVLALVGGAWYCAELN